MHTPAFKRRKEYPQLCNTVYLDHAGTTLYPQSAIRSFARDLGSNLYGNPHSGSPSSSLSTSVVEEVRQQVLNYFSASLEHFDVVFVANATAAIKLVAQAFQDQDQGFWYGYHKDAHTSLVGVRELAGRGHRCFWSDKEVEKWIQNGAVGEGRLGLFGYPAQSNMTGFRPPLSWAGEVRNASCSHEQRVYTLLDAASYLTTAKLSLADSDLAPDFVALSFYKIFGYPDLGALIFRRDAAPILLSRKYFGGGTVEMVIAVGDSWHQTNQQQIHESLEDGTLPFHNILALKHAINSHAILYRSPAQVSNHVAMLSRHAYEFLTNLEHFNGRKVVIVYKDPGGTYGDPRTQGPIISFNVQDVHGGLIWKTRFEALATHCGFQIRTGGLCNPGGVATMLQLDVWELRRNQSFGMRCGDGLDVLGGKPTGVIRISLGAMTNQRDIELFLEFVDFFFVSKEDDTTVQDEDGEGSITAGSIPPIIPIKGSVPFHIPGGEFDTAAEASTAYALWHEDWYVSHPDTKHEITGQEERLKQLEIDLRPADGHMIVTYVPTDESSTASIPKHLTVNLWDPAEGHMESSLPRLDELKVGADAERTTPHDIQEFFTSLLGIPATLSRRDTKEIEALRTDLNVCVAWHCGRHFDTPQGLHSHYQAHARQFKKRTRSAARRGLQKMDPLFRRLRGRVKAAGPPVS